VVVGKGKKVPEVCKLIGLTERTYDHWPQKYGGVQPKMANELKVLQKENVWLEKTVAEQALDMETFKKALMGNV